MWGMNNLGMNNSAYPMDSTPMDGYSSPNPYAKQSETSRDNFQQYVLTGNCYTIMTESKEAELPREANAVRIAVTGTVTRSFNYCCFVWTIIAVSIFIFPLFLFFCQAWKRKVYMLYRINLQVYEAIARIIQTIRPKQVTIIVQDQYFDEQKTQILSNALAGVNNFEFKNVTPGVNTCGSNYDNFVGYMGRLMMTVQRVDCRWDRKVVSNLPI